MGKREEREKKGERGKEVNVRNKGRKKRKG